MAHSSNGADQQGGAGASGHALGFFKNPQALSPTHHGGLRLNKKLDDFSHARETRLAPITIREFERAAADYPIIFAGEDNRPCVVMGLTEGENLFVDAGGALEDGKYAPALLLQHPFFLSAIPGLHEPILMVDRDAASLSETSGSPLFENGEISQATRDALKLLQALQAQLAETEAFAAKLVEHGLIEESALRFAETGQSQKIDVAKFKAVRVGALQNLPATLRQEFDDKGYARLINAAIRSQENWPRLVQRFVEIRRGAA